MEDFLITEAKKGLQWLKDNTDKVKKFFKWIFYSIVMCIGCLIGVLLTRIINPEFDSTIFVLIILTIVIISIVKHSSEKIHVKFISFAMTIMLIGSISVVGYKHYRHQPGDKIEESIMQTEQDKEKEVQRQADIEMKNGNTDKAIELLQNYKKEIQHVREGCTTTVPIALKSPSSDNVKIIQVSNNQTSGNDQSKLTEQNSNIETITLKPGEEVASKMTFFDGETFMVLDVSGDVSLWNMNKAALKPLCLGHTYEMTIVKGKNSNKKGPLFFNSKMGGSIKIQRG